MHISSVAEVTSAPPPIFGSEPLVRTPSSLVQRQSAASTAEVVREPGGKYVALVNGAAVSGANVQSVENSVNTLVDIFA